MKLTNNKAGALLLTIIASMLISFTCASLAVLSLNQSMLIENEIKRKTALNAIRAGYEYAYNRLGQGDSPATIYSYFPLIINSYEINLTIAPDTTGVSEYVINVNATY